MLFTPPPPHSRIPRFHYCVPTLEFEYSRPRAATSHRGATNSIKACQTVHPTLDLLFERFRRHSLSLELASCSWE